MCGIFGFVTANGTFADVDLERATRTLRHRGPDGSRIFESARGTVRCGFAHTRLAIIDLSDAGLQPMTSDDGRFTIVYNGEVYNHVELREELRRDGVVFRSSSDTETLLRAFERWGTACLQRLRGMFAFAVWDQREGTVVLARDHLGIKPLYCVERNGALAFSSELRTLMATGVAERRLSPRGVQSYLTFGSTVEPDTILAGVRMLEPGTFVRWSRDGRDTVRYWSIPSGVDRGISFDDAVARVRARLAESIRLRLVADVPVGVFLSGGLDSSAIVAIASQVSDRALETFTVTFDQRELDEARYAALVADRFGCEHHRVHLPAERALSEMGEAVRALDQPSADGPNVYFISKAATEHGVRVALTGLGGDEMFAGYGGFRTFGRVLAASRAVPAPVRQGLERVHSSMPFGRVPGRVSKALAAFTSPPDLAAVYRSVRCLFTDTQRATLLAPDYAPDSPPETSVPDSVRDSFTSAGFDSVNAYSALELQNYLRNTLLRDADVMSMAHALEVRVPLLDHLLVEALARVPGALKLSRTANKPILQAAAPSIPREAANRPKMGFTLPFETWLRGPMRPWMEETLLGDPARRLGILRREGVDELWRGFLAGPKYVTFSRVWCIATLAAWCTAHEVRA